jgi:hypothetical protein
MSINASGIIYRGVLGFPDPRLYRDPLCQVMLPIIIFKKEAPWALLAR